MTDAAKTGGRRILLLASTLGLFVLVLTFFVSRLQLEIPSPDSSDDSIAALNPKSPLAQEPAPAGFDGETLDSTLEASGPAPRTAVPADGLEIRVLSKAIGEPIPWAVVKAESLEVIPGFLDGPSRKVLDCPADNQGRVVLSTLVFGEQLTFDVQASGFMPEHYEAIPAAKGIFTVQLQLTGVIQGRVLPQEKKIARLTLLQVVGSEHREVTRLRLKKSDEGAFRFEGLEAGTYLLVLERKRRVAEKVEEIVLEAGEVRTVEVVPAELGELVVRVLQRGGDAKIPVGEGLILSREDGLGTRQKAKCSSAGTASFTGLTPGRWVLSAASGRGGQEQIVDVQSGVTLRADFYVEVPVDLELRVTGEGIGADSELRARATLDGNAGKAPKWRGKLSDDGVIGFKGLPPNVPLVIGVSAKIETDDSESQEIVGARRALVLPAQTVPYALSLHLQPDRDFKLIVVDEHGHGMSDAVIRVNGVLKHSEGTFPVPSGDNQEPTRVLLKEPIGPSEIVVSKSGYVTARHRVLIGGSKSQLRVTLTPSARLECRFVQAEGANMESSVLRIERVMSPEQDGRIEFLEPPVTLWLERRRSFDARDLEPGRYEATLSSALGGVATAAVTIRPGEVQSIEFVLGEDREVHVGETATVPHPKHSTKLKE